MSSSASNKVARYYRSKDGRHVFTFYFVPQDDHIAVFCLRHPSLKGQDPSSFKTHLFPSGQLCFAEGQAPREHERAEELARQWAEYFLEYRRTGIPQY